LLSGGKNDHNETNPPAIKPPEIKHFKQPVEVEGHKILDSEYSPPHPIWDDEHVRSVTRIHTKPKGLVEKTAWFIVQGFRKTFDFFSGYTFARWGWGTFDERSVLYRCILLETVAAVPGWMAASVLHLHSLFRMKSDDGWIQTLYEESYNERMHLMTFMELKHPTIVLRVPVAVAQFIFTFGFFFTYQVPRIGPKFCHKFVAYLEEEAVITYTHILEQIDNGGLPMWKHMPAPEKAIKYWKLAPDAKMRDVILAVRADEAHHRDVNHTLSELKSK